MRVAAIEMRDHPGLGDLDIDFRGADGRAARVVVLAGENGCGKTAILETIFSCLAPSALLINRPKPSGGRFRVLLEPEQPITSAIFNQPITPELFHEMSNRYAGFDGLVIEVDPSQERPWYFPMFTRLTDNQSIGQVHQDTVQCLGADNACYFSEANVSFEVPVIGSIRASASQTDPSSLPPERKFPLRGGTTLAAEIAQLFVDLQAADDADVARWVRENDSVPLDHIKKGRIGKFKEAFRRVVPNKIYDRVEIDEGEHRAIFKDGIFETPLSRLSTGEKQIIFRGAFLLKQRSIVGSVVMIDEPELSLHPNWQQSIVPFYEEILNQADGSKGQLIIATHSPFVVHGTPTAKHVILKRETPSRRVIVDPTTSYPGATPASLAITAFDLSAYPNDKHLALIVERPSDKTILETAWLKLNSGRAMPFVVLPAGGARPVQQLLGSEPGSCGPLLSALSSTSIETVVGLFDFDAEGFAQWNGSIKEINASDRSLDIAACAYRRRSNFNVWGALLPVPSFRAGYASLDPDLRSQSRLTIELLFEDVHVANLLSSKRLLGRSGDSFLFATDAQKTAVATSVQAFPPEAFSVFKSIFDFLDRVLTVS